MNDSVREKTGELFGDLWHRYDNRLFDESVMLFAKRFSENGFDLKWFEGKKCLDAGCGGGRYALAMSHLGAGEVVGCDISHEGLEDARRRSVQISNISFEVASVLDMPYVDESFDFVCCSGVLHHTPDPEKGLRELTRILKPSGYMFLLLYGKGGLRWPTIMKIRPHAQTLGYHVIDSALKSADLPANKQRTFLDDFFVPLITFFDWEEVRDMLISADLTDLKRWEKGKLDHESSASVQREEFQQLETLFTVLLEQKDPQEQPSTSSAISALNAVRDAISELDTAEKESLLGNIDASQKRWKIFGWGHHRVLARKR